MTSLLKKKKYQPNLKVKTTKEIDELKLFKVTLTKEILQIL